MRLPRAGFGTSPCKEFRAVFFHETHRRRTGISAPGASGLKKPDTDLSFRSSFGDCQTQRQTNCDLAGLAPFNDDSGAFKAKCSPAITFGILAPSLADIDAARLNPLLRVFLPPGQAKMRQVLIDVMHKLLVILNCQKSKINVPRAPISSELRSKMDFHGAAYRMALFIIVCTSLAERARLKMRNSSICPRKVCG